LVCGERFTTFERFCAWRGKRLPVDAAVALAVVTATSYEPPWVEVVSG
jgi:hypothetical protein